MIDKLSKGRLLNGGRPFFRYNYVWNLKFFLLIYVWNLKIFLLIYVWNLKFFLPQKNSQKKSTFFCIIQKKCCILRPTKNMK